MFNLISGKIRILNNVIKNQSDMIKDLSKTNINFYNQIFEKNFSKKESIIYSGQIMKLRGCKCISYKTKQKQLVKTMFEVLQPNGYNDSVQYLYFDKSAKLIEDDLEEAKK